MTAEPLELDLKAVQMARRFGNLPRCLWVPVAATSLEAISRYIGVVQEVLATWPSGPCAVIVRPQRLGHEGLGCPLRPPVWDLPESAAFHEPEQLWVHVDFDQYLDAYRKVFPDYNPDQQDLVIDHIENRREARLRGYSFIRLLHITRGVNSSSGRGVERVGVIFYSDPELRKHSAPLQAAQGEIRYAGIEDLVKMLGIKMGGQSFDGLRDSLHLFEPPGGGNDRTCPCDGAPALTPRPEKK